MFATKLNLIEMKKITLLLICFLSVAALFAQVTRDKVVVEVGTGTWCTYCPGAAMGIDDLIEEGMPVAAIENHNGDPFANNYSNARNSYYGISGYPTAFFDGGNSIVGGSHTESMYDSYLPKVQARMAVPSPVAIQVYGSHSGLDYNVTVTVTKVSAINGTNPRLHLCITESHIIYAWQGMSEVNFVNRLMVPDQNGTELDFSESDVLEIPLTFTLSSTWVLPQLELVAFVQTNSNKEIHNGYKVKLAWMAPPPPPLAASFTSVTSTCETNQVQYTDMSAGNPNGWYWEFPGGTPDTSREQNPVITYNTAGKYDVSLIVTRGNASDTSFMAEYLDVYELPEVSFDVIEQQCVNYPPVELTQGIPAGGVYSGAGVTDGIFYPEQAGIGTHTLVYTYTDEYNCANSAEQTVVVDACTGLPENGTVQILTLPNPTQGSFRISINNIEDVVNISIINSTGKTVLQQTGVQVNGNYNSMIDLTGNSNGIYYIQVTGKKSNYFKKIILQD
jgi:PKD repeat protein